MLLTGWASSLIASCINSPLTGNARRPLRFEEEPYISYMKRFVEGVNELTSVQHETLSGILQQNLSQRQGIIEPPREMRDNFERAQSDQYCHFHRDKGHTTKKCFQLKKDIQKLIQRGYLKDFVDQCKMRKNPIQREQDSSLPPRRPEQRSEEWRNLNLAGVINVTLGRPEVEGGN
ncbi:hypothetical protein DH2020_016406 [Rehmannia glutinosa]|uniref:Retrotransposon gag domain-containing protein n=1 Tax=Rehmannia glutinosa TaxID=99300 RepID=A0ABR0WMW1_REHGL